MRDVFSASRIREYASCFFPRVDAGCFGMWNCEYGYVFAKKKIKEVFRMWICEYGYVFAKNLQEVFSNVELRIWICFRKKFTRSFFECGIANMDMFSQKSTRSFSNMELRIF